MITTVQGNVEDADREYCYPTLGLKICYCRLGFRERWKMFNEPTEQLKEAMDTRSTARSNSNKPQLHVSILDEATANLQLETHQWSPTEGSGVRIWDSG